MLPALTRSFTQSAIGSERCIFDVDRRLLWPGFDGSLNLKADIPIDEIDEIARILPLLDKDGSIIFDPES